MLFFRRYIYSCDAQWIDSVSCEMMPVFFIKKMFEFDPIFLKFHVCGATRHERAAAGQPRHHPSPKARWLGHGGSQQQSSELYNCTRKKRQHGEEEMTFPYVLSSQTRKNNIIITSISSKQQ